MGYEVSQTDLLADPDLNYNLIAI